MHVLHLGLLYVANGGTMHFARAYVIVLFDHHLGVFFLGGQICVSCLVNISWLRNLLLSIGLWGRADEAVQTRLHRAYLAFKTWCATNQISCSQPAFQPKMDSWNKFVFLCGVGLGFDNFLMVPCCWFVNTTTEPSCINEMAMSC